MEQCTERLKLAKSWNNPQMWGIKGKDGLASGALCVAKGRKNSLYDKKLAGDRGGSA